MVIFSQRWDGNEFFWGYHCYQWFFNGFATTEPSPLNVFSLIDHCYRWFFNGFPKFWYDGQQWFWSWKDKKKQLNVTYRIHELSCIFCTLPHCHSTFLRHQIKIHPVCQRPNTRISDKIFSCPCSSTPDLGQSVSQSVSQWLNAN